MKRYKISVSRIVYAVDSDHAMEQFIRLVTFGKDYIFPKELKESKYIIKY